MSPYYLGPFPLNLINQPIRLLIKMFKYEKNNSLYGSTVLITGGTGSWGNQLTSQLLANYNPKEIRIFPARTQTSGNEKKIQK